MPEASTRRVTASSSVTILGGVSTRVVLAPRPASISPGVDQMVTSPPLKVADGP